MVKAYVKSQLSSSSHFLGNIQQLTDKSFTQVKLHSFTYPNVVKNVSADADLEVQESGGANSTVTLPAGMYSAYDIADKLEDLLNADATLTYTYVVTFDAPENKFTISAGSNFGMVNASSTLGPYIGMFSGSDRTSASSYDSVVVPDLAIHPGFYVEVDLTNESFRDGARSHVLDWFQLDGEFYANVTYVDPSSENWVDIASNGKDVPSSVRITLRDLDGNIMPDLYDPYEWLMVLSFR